MIEVRSAEWLMRPSTGAASPPNEKLGMTPSEFATQRVPMGRRCGGRRLVGYEVEPRGETTPGVSRHRCLTFADD
jgi:hypothetical protein